MQFIVRLQRLSHQLYLRHVPLLPKVIGRYLRLIYGCELPYTVNLPASVVFPHRALGVVLGGDVVLGEGTRVLQNVTIGGRSGVRANPVIGANCLIGANAVVLGKIELGDNVTIGAGSVVLTSIPSNCTAVGVPARVVKQLPAGME